MVPHGHTVQHGLVCFYLLPQWCCSSGEGGWVIMITTTKATDFQWRGSSVASGFGGGLYYEVMLPNLVIASHRSKFKMHWGRRRAWVPSLRRISWKIIFRRY